MKHKQEKTENRKALPKFLGTILLAGLIGGGLGLLLGVVGSTDLPETAVQGIRRFLEIITPHAIWVSTLVLLGMGTWKYRRARRLFSTWDGEAEEPMEQADMQLNWALLAATLTLLLDFFFLAVGVPLNMGLGPVVQFLLALVAMTVLQQKVVDLARQMNPEKRGSIYDMKFQKKWLSSCDENELRQIGQASFQSFKAVTYTCLILWMLLVLLNYVLDVGILPVFLVMLIWGVSQVVYLLESIRLSRRR